MSCTYAMEQSTPRPLVASCIMHHRIRKVFFQIFSCLGNSFDIVLLNRQQTKRDRLAKGGHDFFGEQAHGF